MSVADGLGTARAAVQRWPWWPWARRAVSALIVIAGVSAAISRRHQLTAAARHFGHLRWQWVVVAVVAEAISMLLFARLQQVLLRAGGVDVALAPMAGITLAGNALAMSLPAGGAFSATWSYGQLRR